MKVRILQAAKCNGKRYQAGDTVEIDRGIATGLIDAGAAEPFDAKAAAKAEASAKAEAEAQAKADAEAAEKLAAAGGGGIPPEA